MKTTKTCAQCGDDFEGRSNKIYCSDSCKMQAFQSRQQTENHRVLSNSIPQIYTGKRSHAGNQKLIAKEIELRKYELELEHQRRMIELEQQRRDQFLKEQEMEQVREKNERELRSQQQVDAYQKEYTPIKNIISDIIKQVIDFNEQIVEVAEIEDLLDEIDESMEQISNFCFKKAVSIHSIPEYDLLYELRRLMKDVLSDEDCYESKTELVLDLKRSYVNKLKRFL